MDVPVLGRCAPPVLHKAVAGLSPFFREKLNNLIFHENLAIFVLPQDVIFCRLMELKSCSENVGPVKGAALVEFAMILPLLIFFLLASYEFSRILRIHQVEAAIAREIGRDAYRQCFGLKSFADPNSCPEEELTNACLGQVVKQAATMMRNARTLGAPFIEQLDVAVTAYRLPTAGSQLATRAGFAATATYPAQYLRYSQPLDINSRNNLKNFLLNNEYLIITELVGRYDVTRFNILPNFQAFREAGSYYYVVFH